jgi:integrase
MEGEGLSPSRIRQAKVTLALVLKGAVRDGLIVRNPAGGMDLPRLVHREAPYLEPANVERIATALPHPYGLMVRLMGSLGPRYGEAAALRRRSVDMLRRRLVIEESVAEISGRVILGPTKTHAIRRIPLTPTLAATFERHLDEHVDGDPEAFVFPAPGGGVIRHSNFYFYHRLWQPAVRAAGLPRVGVHVLRHSAAAALIHSGASPKAVQAILGHRSAAFTLTVYGHLFDADLDDVAARLDERLTGRSRDHDGTGHLHVLPLTDEHGA